MDLSAAASEHANLLAERQTVDYAPAALRRASATLSRLQHDHREQSEALKKLEAGTLKEYREWRAFASSKWTRFRVQAVHLGRDHKEKLSTREEKEQAEYLTAFAAEKDAKDALGALASEIQRTETEIKNLQAASGKQAELHSKMSDLLARVFQGPTPSFPQEDLMEERVNAAEGEYERAAEEVSKATGVAGYLGEAMKIMGECEMRMEKALQYSHMDKYSSSIVVDTAERNEIAAAKMCTFQISMIMSEAIRFAPQIIHPLPPINIADQSLMSDVIFDNYWSDRAFHKKIEASMAEVQIAKQDLQGQWEMARRGEQDARAKEAERKAKLRILSSQLWDFRVDVLQGAKR